jgi:hypothetical protein
LGSSCLLLLLVLEILLSFHLWGSCSSSLFILVTLIATFLFSHTTLSIGQHCTINI